MDVFELRGLAPATFLIFTLTYLGFRFCCSAVVGIVDESFFPLVNMPSDFILFRFINSDFFILILGHLKFVVIICFNTHACFS